MRGAVSHPWTRSGKSSVTSGVRTAFPGHGDPPSLPLTLSSGPAASPQRPPRRPQSLLTSFSLPNRV